MLTEIEWWGGLLFIWIAICYRLAYREYLGSGGFSLSFTVFNLAFLCTGFILALYFYRLDGGIIGLAYLGVLVLGIVACGLAVFWPADESGDAAAGGGDEDDEEEEIGPVASALAGVILFFPLLVSLLLGLFKSVEIIGSL